ncbi:hypothetical protein ACM614_14790, partial [Streptomyces sp. 12297]
MRHPVFAHTRPHARSRRALAAATALAAVTGAAVPLLGEDWVSHVSPVHEVKLNTPQTRDRLGWLYRPGRKIERCVRWRAQA